MAYAIIKRGRFSQFSDDFNRANGVLGSNWSTPTGATSLQISASVVAIPASAGSFKWGANAVSQATAAFSNDHEATVTIGGTADSSAGPAVRINTTTGTMYFARVQVGSALTQIERWTGSTNATVASIAGSPAFVAGDTLTLRVVGTTLTVYRNGVLIDGPKTNAILSSGQPGIAQFRFSANGATLDNFVAKDITATPVSGGNAFGLSNIGVRGRIIGSPT